MSFVYAPPFDPQAKFYCCLLKLSREWLLFQRSCSLTWLWLELMAHNLALNSLFPHSVSFDHFEPDLYDHFEPVHTDPDTLGVVARVGERIPVLSGVFQLLHELSGNEEALERARRADPLGSNGVLTHAAEHIPLVNSVLQAVHKERDDKEALERAQLRNPIGSQGYLTKALEHIPLVSDGMVAYHRYQGDDVAAERARGYSVERLFSRDGAITRVAELVPGSNLFAAWFHRMNGDSEPWNRFERFERLTSALVLVTRNY